MKFSVFEPVVLFLRFARLYLRSRMQYRANFLLLIVAIVINYTVTVVGIWVVLTRFQRLADWTVAEVAFLFGLMILSYGLCVFSFVGVREFSSLIHRGHLDKYLVRPRNVLFQVMTTALEPGAIGHVGLGITVLVVASSHLGLTWSAFKVGELLLVVASGTLINMGLMLASAATCFWLVEGREAFDLVATLNRDFFVYPITIYDSWVQVVGTVALPVSFIAFFPAQRFVGLKDSMFPPVLSQAAPVVAIAFFALTYLAFAAALRHYQGTGS